MIQFPNCYHSIPPTGVPDKTIDIRTHNTILPLVWMSVKHGLYEKNKLQMLQTACSRHMWQKENEGQDYCEYNTELRCFIQVAQ
jgi:hypothetical protein